MVSWEIFWLTIGLVLFLISIFYFAHVVGYKFGVGGRDKEKDWQDYLKVKFRFWVALFFSIIVLFCLFAERDYRLDKEHATGVVETKYSVEVLDISPRGEWIEFSPYTDVECTATLLEHKSTYIIVKETAECTEPTSWN